VSGDGAAKRAAQEAERWQTRYRQEKQARQCPGPYDMPLLAYGQMLTVNTQTLFPQRADAAEAARDAATSDADRRERAARADADAHLARLEKEKTVRYCCHRPHSTDPSHCFPSA
jgi:hypothetical protein